MVQVGLFRHYEGVCGVRGEELSAVSYSFKEPCLEAQTVTAH